MKIKISSIYYVFLFIWSLSGTISMAAINTNASAIAVISSFAWNAIRCYIIVKILFEIKNYKRKDIIVLLIIALIGYFSSRYSESSFLIAGFWFIAGAKGIDWNKAIKYLLRAQIFSMLLIFCGCFLGYFPDTAKTGVSSGITTSGIGHSFGYYHPNDLAGSILQIIMMSLYTMKRPLRLQVSFTFLTIAGITLLITRSGTSSLLIAFIALMIAFFSLEKGRSTIGRFISRNLASLMKYIILVLAICSVLFSARQDLGESLLGDFHSRITQMAAYFAYYKITPWGQPLINHASIDYDWRTNLYTLDNAYIHLLLGFGYIVFLLFIAMYIMLIWRAYKSKQYVLLLILCTYTILGFTETMFIRVQYNFTILLFSQIIWKREPSTERLNEVRKT